ARQQIVWINNKNRLNKDYMIDNDYANPFHSFFMGGFECSDKINRYGQRVDLLRETSHIELLKQDYSNLKLLGISTVREGIRWSAVEPSPYQYNFEDVRFMIDAGKEMGIQQ